MYRLSIISGGFEHPPYAYETYQAAADEVEKALLDGLYMKSGPQGTITVQLGVGTILKVMSDIAQAKAQEDRRSAMRNPLLAVKDTDSPWQLVVQIGAAQLPPLDMPSEDAAQIAVKDAVKTGVFRHVIENEQDSLWIQTGAGTVFLVMPTSEFVRQRRAAIEAHMRAVSQARGSTPLIIDPSTARPKG